MDTHTPRDEDNLNDLERRLAGWHPAPEGLDADAMLFAAGRAAGRRGRGHLLWPALTVVLAVQAAGLGLWGLSERAERQILASRLRQRAPALSAPPETAVAESSYTPSPDDYFHLRRRMEQDPSHWLAALSPAGSQALGPTPPKPLILRAGQRDGLLD
jgi:hypothetical protein